MIDERRIEKAAKHYAEENSMLIEDQMGDIYNGIEELSDAYKAGAKEAINEFLKDLWHDVDEMPKRAKAFIFECGDNSMNYYVGMMFNPNDYKKNAEIWHMNRWCYLEDILPKQEGGNQ